MALGKMKSRLVVMDLKCKHKVDQCTHSEYVPLRQSSNSSAKAVVHVGWYSCRRDSMPEDIDTF